MNPLKAKQSHRVLRRLLAKHTDRIKANWKPSDFDGINAELKKLDQRK